MNRMRRRPLRHLTFTLGVAITALLMVTAVLSLVYTPQDPLAMSITGRLQGPSGEHLFGTDQYGRDILSRVMTGTVISIAVGVIAVGIGAAIGIVIGIASGYVGGWIDEAFMRLVDAIQGFPAILSALLFAAVFAPGIVISMVAIGIAFVVAARALGARDRRLIARHILPNTLAPLIVQATTSFPIAILAEAGLAYLGLGTQPPHPSWGLMLREAQSFLSLNPWFAVFPGGAIALTVLGLNLLGDGLRDLLDPKTV
jgi:peptide/nickel transport system permease protein